MKKSWLRYYFIATGWCSSSISRQESPFIAARRAARASKTILTRCALACHARPALVHRLDRDTSGCLVLGRHHKALEKLGLLFKQGKVSKTYWGIVEGNPAGDEGLIDLPLKRLDPRRGWWMTADPSGLPSQTSWRVLSRAENLTLLELTPLTGRTHQLRVHCAAEGWPILGDSIYGHGGAMGLQLHARAIAVPLYKNREPILAEAPVPAHMREALGRFLLPMIGEPESSSHVAAQTQLHVGFLPRR
jgi:tRNA pseudouridine32 synthase / 23S rRNA pseudouridine746 synthase